MATWHAIDSQGMRSARVADEQVVFQLTPRVGEERGTWTQSCSHRAFVGGQFRDSVLRIFGAAFLTEMLDAAREAMAARRRASARRRRATKRAPRPCPASSVS